MAIISPINRLAKGRLVKERCPHRSRKASSFCATLPAPICCLGVAGLGIGLCLGPPHCYSHACRCAAWCGRDALANACQLRTSLNSTLSPLCGITWSTIVAAVSFPSFSHIGKADGAEGSALSECASGGHSLVVMRLPSALAPRALRPAIPQRVPSARCRACLSAPQPLPRR